MASSVYPVHRQRCRVRVRIGPDAGLLVQCGAQDFGQGAYMAISQPADESLSELMARLAPAGLEAEGSATPPDATSFSANAYGAIFGEVGVDPDLGEVRARRVCAAFADDPIPTHAAIPDFDIVMVDEDDPHLPGGAKRIGMLGSAGVQSAIASAVYDAVGKRIRHLPIRIEDLI